MKVLSATQAVTMTAAAATATQNSMLNKASNISSLLFLGISDDSHGIPVFCFTVVLFRALERLDHVDLPIFACNEETDKKGHADRE